MHVALEKKRYSYLLFLFCFFLLIFPKGGIKLGGVPLTWGYFLLGLSSFYLLFQKTYCINRDHIRAQLLFFPFQVISLFSFFFLGVQSTSGLVSFIVTVFLLPFSIFTLHSSTIDQIDKDQLFSLVKKAIVFLASYGIFLFFYKALTGQFIKIPLLTVNLQDYQTLDDKCIDRGYAFKLISTYNNGNLYGICMLMLLPLFMHIAPSKSKKALIITSLILTLSRTVWMGIVFSEILVAITAKSKEALISLAAQLLTAAALLYSLCYYYEIPLEFFLDFSLGGRLNNIHKIEPYNIFGNSPFVWINEITYLGVLENFGLSGLLSFILFLLAPLLLYLLKKGPRKKEDLPLILGILNYCFLSLSDGAFLLIPVMVFYYFISAFLLRESPLLNESMSPKSIQKRSSRAILS